MIKLKETKTTKKILALTVVSAMILSLSPVAADTNYSTHNNKSEIEAGNPVETSNEQITTVSEEEITTAATEETTTATAEEITTTAVVEETTTAAETTTTTYNNTTPAIGDLIISGGYIYKITSSNTVTLKGFATGFTVKSVVVLNTITYNGVKYKVTKVGNSAFKGETGITKVTIRKNVTDIGKNAFYGCTKLTKVTIRTGVTIIRKNSFKKCKKLKTVNITSTVLKDIKTNAFKGIKSGAVINVMNKTIQAVVKSAVPSTVKVNKM